MYFRICTYATISEAVHIKQAFYSGYLVIIVWEIPSESTVKMLFPEVHRKLLLIASRTLQFSCNFVTDSYTRFDTHKQNSQESGVRA